MTAERRTPPAGRAAPRARLAGVLCAALLAGLSGTAGAGEGLTRLDGGAAPAFRLEDIDGARHALADYRGRPVIINFWATWCPPCRRELPAMNRAWAKVRDAGIAMLAIDVGEDEDTIFTFTGDYPIDFTILLDRDGAVAGRWPILGLPTTFVVAPDGTLAYRAIGSREWDDATLLDQVRALRTEVK